MSDEIQYVEVETIKRVLKSSVGIGSKSHTLSELRKACAMFFDVEEIVENQSKLLAKSSTPKPDTTPKPKPNETPKPKPTSTPKPKLVAA